MKKKSLLAVALLLLIFMISAVSAADASGTDSQSAISSVESDSIAESSVDESDSLSVSSDVSEDVSSDASSQEVLTADNSSTIIESSGANDSTSKETVSALQSSEKQSSSISGSGSSVIRGYSYTSALVDSNNKALSGKNITFTISGKTYTITTDSNGKAALPISLAAGTYSLKMAFAGDDDYLASSKTININVLANTPAITTGSTSVVRGYYFYAYLKDKAGKALSGEKLTIKVNGKTYTKTTNSNGRVALKITLPAGSYKMNIYHYASGIYSYASKSVTLKSVANTPSITVADSTVIRGKYLYVYLKDKTGKALSGQKVTFKFNGKTYTKTTNSNGRAALKFTLNAGKYYTQIYHYASGVYAYKKKALTVSVLKNTPKITVSTTTLIKNNNLYFYLKDGAGAAMKSAKLTITLNGKTYTRTTDSNGRASLYVSLAAKSYSLKASYAASSVYSKASISKTLNVINDPSKNSINNILTAASSLEAYVNKNKALPKTVTVGSYSVSIDEFSYLMAEAIGNLNNGNKNDVSIKNNIAANSPMNYTLNAKVYKAQYINLTKEILSFANANNYMPNYATVHNSSNQAAGKAGFGLYTFCFAKILDFYKSEGYLPNYCTFDSSVLSASSSSSSSSSSNSSSSSGSTSNSSSSSSSSSSSGSSFTVKDIETAASNVEAYVNKNKVLPKTVTVGSTSVSIDEFSYLMAQTISELNKGSSASIAHKSLSSNNPVNYTLSATIHKAQYVKTANEILTFVSSNKYMPNYATVYSTSGSSAGKAGFGLYTFCFAKILDFYKSEGYLPNYCTFNSSVFASSSSGSGSSSPSTSANGTVTTANSSQYKAGLNVKSSEGNLDQYLVSSGFATITTAIKNKAASLTKGLTTNAAKATAIFNFVRDNIAYSYYANSKRGADGTLSAGSANCCDQANLVVALCRAAGIPARYSHAQGCTFSSGLVTGHVWAQIYIGGTWYSADATSTRNSLGNIKNWNTNSYYSLKNYATIPF